MNKECTSHEIPFEICIAPYICVRTYAVERMRRQTRYTRYAYCAAAHRRDAEAPLLWRKILRVKSRIANRSRKFLSILRDNRQQNGASKDSTRKHRSFTVRYFSELRRTTKSQTARTRKKLENVSRYSVKQRRRSRILFAVRKGKKHRSYIYIPRPFRAVPSLALYSAHTYRRERNGFS